MRTFIKAGPSAASVIALFCLCAFLSASGRAQTPPPAPGSVAGQTTVGALLARLGREAKVGIVVDSSVDARAPVPGGVVFPPAAAQTVEQRLDTLVHALPPGATWTRLDLPPLAPASRPYNGDDLAALVAVEARLFGTNVSAVAAPGTGQKTIVLQRLSTNDVKKPVGARDVHPVYLVTNGVPGARTGSTSANGGADALAAWSQLTPAQRDQMTAGILNMNPALRNQMMQQLVSVFMTVMQKMSPEERQQMLAGTPVTAGATGRPDLP